MTDLLHELKFTLVVAGQTPKLFTRMDSFGRRKRSDQPLLVLVIKTNRRGVPRMLLINAGEIAARQLQVDGEEHDKN